MLSFHSHATSCSTGDTHIAGTGRAAYPVRKSHFLRVEVPSLEWRHRTGNSVTVDRRSMGRIYPIQMVHPQVCLEAHWRTQCPRSVTSWKRSLPSYANWI